MLIVMTLHAHLAQGVKSFTCHVHLTSLGPDHPGHLQHLPSMLQMTNVVIAAGIVRSLLGTLIIAVDIAFVILGHHGVRPKVADHGLRDILLNGSLLSTRQDIGTLYLRMDRIFSIDVNAFHGMAQHLSLEPTHLKQGLAIVKVGLSTLYVSLAKFLGENGAALSHVIHSFRDIEVLLHAHQQLLGILHAACAHSG